MTCLCPGDCNCRHQGQPYNRPNLCGCRAHDTRTILIHLNVEVPATDQRSTDEIADEIVEAAGAIGHPLDLMRIPGGANRNRKDLDGRVGYVIHRCCPGLSVSAPLVEEV